MRNTKKLLALFLALLLAVLSLPVAFAEESEPPVSGECGAEGASVSWALSAEGVLTISGTGAMLDYDSAVEVPWAESRLAITAAEISDGVTHIGGYAFYGCEAMKSVRIPASVLTIGEFAFYGCAALQSLTLPEKLQSADWFAFYGCASLKELVVPNGVTSLGDSVFSQCTALTTASLPATLSELPFYLFNGCAALASFTVPKGVTVIGSGAFNGCTALTTFTVPKWVTAIGEIAFAGCKKLESVEILNGSCEIPMIETTFPTTTMLCGYEGSTAQAYAAEFERAFDLRIEIPEHDCVWENPTVTKEPTCSAEGETTFTCSICGETKTEPIAKTAHTPAVTPAVRATCKSTGLTKGKHCAVCGAVIQQQAKLPKTGHTWKEKVGAAKIGKTGKLVKTCIDCGVKKTSVIAAIKSVELSQTEFQYDGKAHKPTVTIKDTKGKKLKENTDYKLTYDKGRKAAGIYAVKITFIGHYTGKKTLKFKILPGKVPSLTATALSGGRIQLSWSKASGAKQYAVYFRRAGNDTFKRYGVTTKTTFTDKGFSAGVTYYFKVRALAENDNGTCYGEYSPVKSKMARR